MIRLDRQAIDDNRFTIHKDVRDAFGGLAGLLKRCWITDRLRVEEDQVGEVAFRDCASLLEPKTLGRIAGHTMHGLFESLSGVSADGESDLHGRAAKTGFTADAIEGAQYANAAAAFGRYVRDYPGSDDAPQALYQKGYAHEILGEYEDLKEGSEVKRTGTVVQVPVGITNRLLGLSDRRQR